MKIIRKGLTLMLSLIIAIGILAGCTPAEKKIFDKQEDFSDAKIGVLLGSSFDLLVDEYFPEADKLYYPSITDLILNLEQGKIDGILIDKGFFTPVVWEGEPLSYIEMDMPATEFAIAFPKTEESEYLKAQINEFIKEQTENGWLEELKTKWLSYTEPDGKLDLDSLTGENGTLRVATTVESKPFDYLKDGQFCGFDADFIYRFAEEYGYDLEIDTMDFGALLPSISAGRYDLAISSITVTEERKESVNFSDIYCESDIVMAILDEGAASRPTLSDIENVTLGIVTGTSLDIVAQEKFPNAERKYFGSTADAILALDQGKVDVIFEDRTVYIGSRWENANIYAIDEPIETVQNALILAKDGYDENLLNQLNTFIAKIDSDGTLATIQEKWFNEKEPTEHPDYTKLTGENGTLKIAIGDSMKPVAYQKGEFYTGYDVEFLTLFAEEYGYKLDMNGMAFDALIPSVASGKCDIGACGITITPERKESVTFTDSHFETDVLAVLRSEPYENNKSKKTLADFENSSIGVLTGSVYDDFAKDNFPEAEREYYSLMSDLIVAVEQGKVDGFISENTYVTAAIWEGADIEYIDDSIAQTQAGFIFQKSEESAKLREQMNSFIKKIKENGTYDELNEKWFGKAEPEDGLDFDSLTGENGTIRVAVAPDLKPISYIKDGEVSGYEMEVILLFAKEYGYKLEIDYMTFDAILPGVTTGKYDIGTGAVTITEERAQSLDFSDSHLAVDVVMVVKAEEDSTEGAGFFDELKEDFEKTFIREDRWKLIVEGIGVTMLISVCAAIAGTLLGFGLYMLSRSDIKLIQLLAKKIAKVYSRIIAGTPVVVILMILFYVIFGSFRDMSGILVAIIGFTLTFGSFVYSHMVVSVDSVPLDRQRQHMLSATLKTKPFSVLSSLRL